MCCQFLALVCSLVASVTLENTQPPYFMFFHFVFLFSFWKSHTVYSTVCIPNSHAFYVLLPPQHFQSLDINMQSTCKFYNHSNILRYVDMNASCSIWIPFWIILFILWLDLFWVGGCLWLWPSFSVEFLSFSTSKYLK